MTSLSDIDRLHENATPGPFKWLKVGKSWVLAGDYGMTPFALVLGRDARLRDATRDLLVPFDPEHPEAKRILATLNAYPALRAYVAALEAERDASREVMRYRDRMLWLCDENTTEDIEAVRVTRLATDAAREKMEKQDG